MRVIILDLDYSLVMNPKECPGIEDIKLEKYDRRITNQFSDHDKVYLYSNRSNRFEYQIITQLRQQLYWVPTLSFFNNDSMELAQCIDRDIVKDSGSSFSTEMKKYNTKQFIMSMNLDLSVYIAIEADKKTREMYNELGIKAITKEEFLGI
jgi:phosphoribosylaminoimidazole carboxylase (NCAIR synthetase)